MQLGPAEVLVILVVALLVFGPTRLPEIGRQVGRGMRELRKFQDSLKRDFDEVIADDAASGGDPPPTLPPKRVEAGPMSPPPQSTATESSPTEPSPTDPA